MSETEINTLEPWLKPFESEIENRDSGEPSWLYPLRKSGISSFSELGFPTSKDEDWRFTNVKPVTTIPFHPTLKRPEKGDVHPNSAGIVDNLTDWTLVFMDGHFHPTLSTLPPEQKGVIILSIREAIHADLPDVKSFFADRLCDEKNAFEGLNLAYFTDGAFIHIGANIELKQPIHLKFIHSASTEGQAQHIRNLIMLGRNSKASVVESYLTAGPHGCTSNVSTELKVDEGARLEFCKVQDEDRDNAFHFASIHARMERDSHTSIHSIDLGSRISRNNIHTKLNGTGLTCVLNGLYFTRDRQLADHHMVVEHAQPHCESHEYFNGILDGHSRGVFHGRIFVHQIAQKTDAKQTNKNLLLSDTAIANTKPQLEIYADDVKCTHGATIGQMNEEAIFYLRARGIGLEEARRMLIHAFASEIIERIQFEPLRERLDEVVWDRLEKYTKLTEYV